MLKWKLCNSVSLVTKIKLLTSPLPVNNWLPDPKFKVPNPRVTIFRTYCESFHGWAFVNIDTRGLKELLLQQTLFIMKF